jgi:hypothetical protein
MGKKYSKKLSSYCGMKIKRIKEWDNSIDIEP